MKNLNFKKYYLLTVIVIFLLLLCANDILFTKNGYVRVKGSAEKLVTANTGYWNLYFTNSGNDLKTIKNKNSIDLEKVIKFLKDSGFSENEIKINPLELIDIDSREYKDPNLSNRYILTQGVSIITENVDLLEKSSQKIDKLIDQNVLIKSGYGESRPIYKFTKINAIKQKMLEEATINARNTAEQFAKDSKTKVAYIKYANQGIFNIEPKNKGLNFDENFEKEKEVRVVITIEYWLK